MIWSASNSNPGKTAALSGLRRVIKDWEELECCIISNFRLKLEQFSDNALNRNWILQEAVILTGPILFEIIHLGRTNTWTFASN
jgi:hypothetical protein